MPKRCECICNAAASFSRTISLRANSVLDLRPKDESIERMFFKSRQMKLRPWRMHEQRRPHDQLPYLAPRGRFSALPHLYSASHKYEETENLSLFVAILYVIDLFGVFPFVTLPSLLVELGFFGIPLVISIIALQIYTSYLLSKCWNMSQVLDPSIVQKSRYPYAAIAELAYGPFVSLLVTILLDLSIFATSIPNLVMASQNLELVGERISDNKFSISFCFWLIIIGLFICPLMWMGSPKHMRGLAIISMCVMIFIVILLWFCLFAAVPIGTPFQGVSRDLPPFLTVLSGYSVLAFQFDIHPMLLTLQIDMQQKSQVFWVAFSGITITCTIAIFGSLIAGYKFGNMISENLLETLPTSIPLYILIILIALQLCFSAIVGSSAMFLQIENYFKISESLSLKRIAIRSTIVTLQVVIAEFVPSFDVLMDLVGGTITGPLVFILPPLLYRRISQMERMHQRIVVEATYGSLPIDLNYERTTMSKDGETLLLSPDGQWNRRLHYSLHTLRRLARYICSYLHCDFSLSMSVLIFGIVATFLATYLNIFQIDELFHQNSCLANLTNLP